MLDNNIAIINSWYSNKPDLLPRNTIKEVDVTQNEVSVVGGSKGVGMIFSNVLYPATWSDTELTGYYGTWTSYTLDGQTNWANADPQMQGVSSLTAIYEQTGNLVYKFENTWGDTNAENYSVTGITHKIRPLGTSSTLNYTYNHFQGTRNHTPADDNPITPVFTFDGNWIYMTVPHCLIRGRYGIIWKTGSSRFDELFPFQFSWTINYGGFKVKEVLATFGSDNLPYEISKNGFIEKSSVYITTTEVDGEITTTNVELGTHLASKIISKWQNGRQYLTAEIPCIDYYNENGDKLIDINGTKPLLNLYDKVAFKNRGQYVYVDSQGNSKVFIIMKKTFNYKGKKTLTIECLEEVL